MLKSPVLQSFFLANTVHSTYTILFPFLVSDAYSVTVSGEYENVNDDMKFPVKLGIQYQFEKRVLWKTISCRRNLEVKIASSIKELSWGGGVGGCL